MPFGVDHEVPEGTLVDIDDTKDPPVAVFSTGEPLKFPKGTKFVPDNHVDPVGNTMALRLRYMPPRDSKGALTQPSFLIPKYCSREYVLQAIKRIELKV